MRSPRLAATLAALLATAVWCATTHAAVTGKPPISVQFDAGTMRVHGGPTRDHIWSGPGGVPGHMLWELRNERGGIIRFDAPLLRCDPDLPAAERPVECTHDGWCQFADEQLVLHCSPAVVRRVEQHGFAGRDTLRGHMHLPTLLDGGPGRDELIGDHGDDDLRGGAGNDEIEDGDEEQTGPDARLVSDDRLDGGAGDDWLFSHGGRDLLIGGAGDDEATLTRRASGRVEAGPGDDSVGTGGPLRGPFTVLGGPGDDEINLYSRDVDTIDCGPGRDRVEAGRRDRVRNCEVVRRHKY